MNKRLLSKLLALCMVVTMLPVSAMAEEAHTTIGTCGEIISFAPLTETEKTVAVGTTAEDLELPEKLTATVRTAITSEDTSVQDSESSDEDTSVDDLTTAPIDSGVTEDSSQDPDSSDEDTVSGNVAVASASSTTEASIRDSSNGDEDTEEDSVSATSGSSIEAEVGQTRSTEEVPDPEWEVNTVDIPVTWVSTDYDPNTEGDYVFTPVIDDYTVSAELAELPQVTVTVEAAVPMMRALLGSSGSTVIEVNNSAEIGYYIENATGNLELKLISSGFATAYVMTTIPVHIGYDITIDLNGQTMANDNSGTENVIRKIGNGKLTIKDSSGGSGKITRPKGSGPAILNESTGEIIIEGGRIDSVYASAIVSNNGPVTFKGGEILNTDGIGIQCDNSTVTIEGGDINSTGNSKTTISANIINVSGGMVQNGSYQGSTLVGNTISVSSGTVKTGTPDGYAIKGNDDATITLTGGTTQNISWSGTGIAINPGTRGTIRIPSGTVTVIGDAMAMLQALDLSGYSNVVISGNTTSADDTGLVVITLGALEAELDQYKYVLFEPGTGLTKEPMPEAVFTATGPREGTLSGLSAGLKCYILDRGMYPVDSSENISLSNLEPGNILLVRKGNGTTTADSDAQTITITKAATPTLTATQPSVIGGSGSIPMTSAHEYSTNGGSSWCNASGAATLAAGTYLVRVKSAGTMLASENQIITLTAFTVTKEPMPEATFTATGPRNGTLSGLTAGLKCYIEGRGWHPIDSSANIPLSNLEPGNILLVRKGNGTTTADSDAQTITVTKAATPTLTATQPSVIGGNGSIPMTTAHEYCTYGGSSWSNASGAATLAAGTYLVRVKAAGTMLASENQSITLTAFTGTKEPMPEATFSATGPYTGILTGVASGMKYRIGSGIIWTDISSGTDINLSSLSACTISVVKKGDGITTSDSNAQTITVTKAATPTLTATQPSVIGGSGSILMTAEHEYSDDGSSWSNATGATILAAGTYLVRVRASGTMLASEDQIITLAAFTGTKETTPEAAFTATGPNYGILTGVASGMKYRIDDGAWKDISSGTDITLSDLSGCTISVVKKGDGITTRDSNAQTITVTKAAKPTLTASQPGVIGGSGSIPMTAAHEFSADGGSSWSNASGPTTLVAGTYRVRVRAAGTMLASEPQEITLIAFTGTKEATPESIFSAAGPDTGTLIGVTNGMKYRIDDVAWTDISSGADINLSGISACTISVVKKGDGMTTIDSDPQIITVTKAEKPDLMATQPGVIGGSGSITMTAAHEYSADGGSSWSNASGTTTLDVGTYLVRVRAAGTILASEPQEITLTAFSGMKEATPEVTFSAAGPDTGILTSVANGMKYRIDDGAWTDISSGADINLSALSACTISVVKKGDGMTTSDSDAQNITITKAATPDLTATQPIVIGGSGSIPMTAAHEYSADGGSSWSNASGTTTLDAGTYQVRVRASGTMLASEPQEITLTAFTGTRESTPTANVDYAAEKLTGLTANGSYLVGAATITADTNGEIDIDNSWFGTAISLIKKGNGTITNDSTAQSISLAARPAAPACTVTQPSASSATGTISGIGTTMEYSTNGGTDWTIGTGTDIAGLSPGIVLIRMKATTGAPAGLSQSITITAYLPNALTGTATISNTAPRIGDRLTGSLVGGNNTGTLTYVWKARGTQVGIGSEYIVAAADYGKMITLEISSSVETGTRTSTATEAVAKKTAPAAPSAPTLSSKTHNNITLTANAAYAFSKDGSTWQTSNVFSGLSASTEYTFYQRVAETADTEASGASPGFSVTTNSNGGGGNGGNTSGNSNSGNSNSGSGGSSSDNSSHVIVTPPAPDKPNSPTQGEIKVPGTVDSKGNIKVKITDKTVTDAFDKALEDAKKNGNEQNGITVVLRVDTGSKTGSNVTVNLPKTVQDIIIEKKIVNIIVVLDNPDIRIDMDLATVQQINKQAKSDVNIIATRTDSGKLTGEAKRAIGNRPVFDLKVNYGSGKQVQNFGQGSVSVTIPYTLGANEKAGNVQAVYVDAKGKVHWLVNSVYDSAEKLLRFSTNHFSTYGIGYKQADTAFTDIAGHWAKEDIEFVASCGLFSGTSDTTFSPNTAMTRGMFITALGRLANADVSGYKQSSFTDVKSDAYYMGYIEWASKNTIVNGTDNGKFAPDQSITREQMAVIMQNYAKVIGFTLPKVHKESTFADSGKISAYARDAVRQTQMAGIFSGKDGNLFDPKGTATRAEASAVLRRFVEPAISSGTMQNWTNP